MICPFHDGHWRRPPLCVGVLSSHLHNVSRVPITIIIITIITIITITIITIIIIMVVTTSLCGRLVESFAHLVSLLKSQITVFRRQCKVDPVYFHLNTSPRNLSIHLSEITGCKVFT